MAKVSQINGQENGQARDVLRVIEGRETSDGAGVSLRRYIGSPDLDMLDPFLLLDVFKSDDPEDYIAGFPTHPHRGFETVTYLLHGRMRHKDNAGHEGVIESGGVQWMTAGAGIEHSEMPEQEQGLLYGFQLWVNLPADLKMMPPRYQELQPEAIPVEHRQAGVSVRVVAGTTSQGTSGPVTEIAAQPVYFDINLDDGQGFHEVLPAEHHAFIYVVNGEVSIKGSRKSTRVLASELAILDLGAELNIEAQQASRFLLVAGRPFNEPVVRYGPFVMNTRQQIEQAFVDYNSGSFGQI